MSKGSETLKKIETFDYKSTQEIIDTMPNDKQELCNKILNQIKFMEITLKDLQKEIQDKGVVVDMCQGKYFIQRTNPALNQYNTTIKNYANCIKQLNDLLPDDAMIDDDFENDDLE